MKMSFLKLAGKKFLTASFISATLLLSAAGAKAATVTNPIEVVNNANASIEYTGSTNDALMLTLRVKNAGADNFTVTVKNDAGDVLFSKSFNEVNFNKQFKVLKPEDTNENYTFVVSSSNKNLDGTFVVTSTTKTVNDVVVNKL